MAVWCVRLAYISTAIDTVFHFAARNDFPSVQCLLSRTCPLHVEVSFHSVMEQDADIRENLYFKIVLSDVAKDDLTLLLVLPFTLQGNRAACVPMHIGIRVDGPGQDAGLGSEVTDDTSFLRKTRCDVYNPQRGLRQCRVLSTRWPSRPPCPRSTSSFSSKASHRDHFGWFHGLQHSLYACLSGFFGDGIGLTIVLSPA